MWGYIRNDLNFSPTPLIGKTNGVEVALISQIPTAAEVVDRDPVALGPVPVELAHHVVPGGVIVARLKILRFEEVVRFSKLSLVRDNLVPGTTDAKHRVVMHRHRLGWVITCNHDRGDCDGDRLGHELTTASGTTDDGGTTLHHDRLRRVNLLLVSLLHGLHDGLHHDGLEGRGRMDNIGRRLNWDAGVSLL